MRHILEDFESTHGLSVDVLRELVHSDDALTRLHAVWALGLRATSLFPHLRDEPDPGVRRALAVVLAAQGEVDLLVVLCRQDPNVHVRASTVQIVIRFAAAGKVPWSIVAERFADAAEVRAATVSQLDASSPPDLRNRALAALDDPEEIVRREAFEVALKLVAAGVADASCVVDALDRMSRGECANALAHWFAVATPAAIATGLFDASRSVRELAIRARPSLAFTDLWPLIADDPDLLRIVDRKVGEPPLHLLARHILDAPRHEFVRELGTRLAARTIWPAELTPMLGELRALCAQQVGALRERLASEELDDDTRSDLGWVQDAFRVLATALGNGREIAYRSS